MGVYGDSLPFGVRLTWHLEDPQFLPLLCRLQKFPLSQEYVIRLKHWLQPQLTLSRSKLEADYFPQKKKHINVKTVTSLVWM